MTVLSSLAARFFDHGTPDHARLTNVLEHLAGSDTHTHELALWRSLADAYGTRMTLAENVCRQLLKHPHPHRDVTSALGLWKAEHARQTEGAA